MEKLSIKEYTALLDDFPTYKEVALDMLSEYTREPKKRRIYIKDSVTLPEELVEYVFTRDKQSIQEPLYSEIFGNNRVWNTSLDLMRVFVCMECLQNIQSIAQDDPYIYVALQLFERKVERRSSRIEECECCDALLDIQVNGAYTHNASMQLEKMLYKEEPVPPREWYKLSLYVKDNYDLEHLYRGYERILKLVLEKLPETKREYP